MLGCAVRPKHLRQVVMYVPGAPPVTSRRLKHLFRFKPTNALGNLLKRSEMIHRSNLGMATLVVQVQVDASHDNFERPRDDRVSCLVQRGSFLVVRVPRRRPSGAVGTVKIRPTTTPFSSTS